VGRIESGFLKKGDELLFSPSNKTASVASLENWNHQALEIKASAGQSVAIVLDEEIFIERGHIASLIKNPPIETNVFQAKVFWIGDQPIRTGDRFKIKIATSEHSVEVQSIESATNVDNLEKTLSTQIEKNGIGEITFRARSAIALDSFDTNPRTGRFVLIDGYETVGGGTVSMQGYADQRGRYDVTSQNILAVTSRVDKTARINSNRHKGGIVWLTGLSGAGKSTIAMEVEQQLFLKGYQVYVLDGDNIRFGLSSDLGFSPEDRTENIRRVGEVAKLFAEAGLLIITAFISPYRHDRDRVRTISPEIFHEVFIKADLSICEDRDPKGLYARARNGEIPEFTGITAPYEEPDNAELIIDTSKLDVDQSAIVLLDYISKHFKS
jgi:bifunctional enzyme CysN/CysC